ncbi:NAD-dependent epimerase/dehydratase family protein [Sulfitobacter guttiformis]|uniref:dTDP-4-dehydrorhamnose reductase n=1 Tax=Sulfitobacter guttiformis TaxID=74349 RepID=A0A420DRW3_9RHOB|nr:NAD-dependent epimerase/dehydratase family protein [Sulfitobacter guttiformis]KIN74318.1 NAD dependent epimerase/dehydratase [Sulfitobacter guttiformis KCTC 32187]RKE96918.1 dTDP-4-dehydrorhamnose reductase [Sulfitobacter guttiformis]
MRSIITKKSDTISSDLLLGAGGRLGQMLCRFWPQPELLCTQSRQYRAGALRFDPLAAPDVLAAAAADMRSVICLSGVTPAHAAASGDSMSLNTTLALAAVAAAPLSARVFVVSSAAVYGACAGPNNEADSVTPVSAYGEAKLAMERATLALGRGRVCVLRIGNVAGADAILGGWRAGMTLDQLPDGRTPRRSYIGPQTLARVIHALCGVPKLPPILNIAAPGVIGMGDLLDQAGLPWTPRTPIGPVIEEVALHTAALERFFTFTSQESTAQGMVAQWKQGQPQA